MLEYCSEKGSQFGELGSLKGERVMDTDKLFILQERIRGALAVDGRQQFVGKVRMSASTLHDLLTGRLPWVKSEATSERQYRAWARTAAKLALYFGNDPKEWLDGLGIPDTPIISDAASDAFHEGLVIETPRATESGWWITAEEFGALERIARDAGGSLQLATALQLLSLRRRVV